MPHRESAADAGRMVRFAELQKRAFALLAASPEGYRDFGSAICESDAFMPPSDPAAPVELLASLTRTGVTFVIIGGHAVNFHGYVRTTEDTNIVFLQTKPSEAALLEALQSMRACWISDERDPQTERNDSFR